MHVHKALLLLTFLSAAGIMSYPFSSTAFGTDDALGNMTSTSYSNATTSDSNAPNTQPTVDFPTREEVSTYNMELGSEIIQLTNSSLGDAISLKAASKGNETFIAWLAEIDGTNRVFLSITRDEGANYSEPKELSRPSVGNASSTNASNLQLAVYDSYVDVVWQSTDLTTGTSNIIGSVSMDNGYTFKTYQINVEGTDARDPVLPGNFIIAWIQEGEPCGPPGPPPNGAENVSTSTVATNSTATDGTQQGGSDDDLPDIVCLRFRW
jgi:hypothetical protein